MDPSSQVIKVMIIGVQVTSDRLYIDFVILESIAV